MAHRPPVILAGMNGALLTTLHPLARKLGLPPGWLKAEALAGRIPCLKAGRRLLFNPSAVEASLSARAATERRTAKGVAGAD